MNRLNNLLNRMSFMVRQDERILFAFVSFVISLLVYSATPLTNTDGVLYLRVADTFQKHGYGAALDVYANPYYSIVVGVVASLLSIKTLLAAQLINSLACAIIAWCMVDVGRQLSNSHLVGVITGCLFLLLPPFNEYRNMVIRDFCFWAFVMTFVSLYMRFLFSLKPIYLCIGFVSLFVGALFRVESIVLLVIPLLVSLVLRKNTPLFRASLKIYCLFLGVIFMLVLSIGLSDSNNIGLWMISAQNYIHVMAKLIEEFSSMQQAFEAHLLNGYLAEYASAAIVIAFLTILILKTLKTITLPYLIMAVMSAKGFVLARFSVLRLAPLLIFMGYYFFVVYVYLLGTQVIQGRHVIPLILLSLPILATALDCWLVYQRTNSGPSGVALKKIYLFLAVIVVYLFIDSFISFGEKKTYDIESSAWLHSQSSKCQLLTNATNLAYFSGMQVDWERIDDFYQTETIDTFLEGIVAIRADKGDDTQLLFSHNTNYQLHRTFAGKYKKVDIWLRDGTSCEVDNQ